ncbi:metalloregulator ArsR/SmtB family transcription factor [bacterium]|nr:metalloregulator ArsR/SmtB family transcription factor [bacterium]
MAGLPLRFCGMRVLVMQGEYLYIRLSEYGSQATGSSMDAIVEYLKALAEESRLRILMILEQAGELSVADIGHVLQIPQPKVSRHLSRLRLAGWVKERRWKGWSLYRVSLAPGDIHREYLIGLCQKLEADKTVASDLQRLMSLRRSGSGGAGAGEERFE